MEHYIKHNEKEEGGISYFSKTYFTSLGKMRDFLEYGVAPFSAGHLMFL